MIDGEGPQASLPAVRPDAVLGELARSCRPKWPDGYRDQMACVVGFGNEEEIMSFDIVPAFDREGGGYEIPDTRTGGWIATNLASTTNEHGQEHGLRRQVRAVREDDQGHEPSPRRAGQPVVPLEVMAQGIVLDRLRRIPRRDRGSWPPPSSRSTTRGPTPPGSARTSTRCRPASDPRPLPALADALAIAEKAIDLAADGHERSAVEQWRELFGWRMPRP